MRRFLGKALRRRESYNFLVHLHLTIGSVSVDGVIKFEVQIPIIDEILMGYWVVDQVRTMRSSVMYKSPFRVGEIIFRRLLMIFCDMSLRDHLKNTMNIDLFGSVNGRADGLGDEL